MKFKRLARNLLKEFQQQASKRVPANTRHLSGDVKYSCELEMPIDKFPSDVVSKYDAKYGVDSNTLYVVAEYSVNPIYSDDSFYYEYGNERGTHHQHSWEFDLEDWKLSTPEEDDIFTSSEQERVDLTIQDYIEGAIGHAKHTLAQKAEKGAEP